MIYYQSKAFATVDSIFLLNCRTLQLRLYQALNHLKVKAIFPGKKPENAVLLLTNTGKMCIISDSISQQMKRIVS